MMMIPYGEPPGRHHEESPVLTVGIVIMFLLIAGVAVVLALHFTGNLEPHPQASQRAGGGGGGGKGDGGNTTILNLRDTPDYVFIVLGVGGGVMLFGAVVYYRLRAKALEMKTPDKATDDDRYRQIEDALEVYGLPKDSGDVSKFIRKSLLRLDPHPDPKYNDRFNYRDVNEFAGGWNVASIAMFVLAIMLFAACGTFLILNHDSNPSTNSVQTAFGVVLLLLAALFVAVFVMYGAWAIAAKTQAVGAIGAVLGIGVVHWVVPENISDSTRWTEAEQQFYNGVSSWKGQLAGALLGYIIGNLFGGSLAAIAGVSGRKSDDKKEEDKILDVIKKKIPAGYKLESNYWLPRRWLRWALGTAEKKLPENIAAFENEYRDAKNTQEKGDITKRYPGVMNWLGPEHASKL